MGGRGQSSGVTGHIAVGAEVRGVGNCSHRCGGRGQSSGVIGHIAMGAEGRTEEPGFS